MNEAEWLSCGDSWRMMTFLLTRPRERKARLYVCACCRLAEHLLIPEARHALEVAERFADGYATRDELQRARSEARHAGKRLKNRALFEDRDASSAARLATNEDVTEACRGLGAVKRALHHEAYGYDHTSRRSRHDDFLWIIRDVFGNPFRPVHFDRAWRTFDVVSLATAAYEERALSSGELALDRLAVLADALEEIGAAEEVVVHLRSSGPHVRGCWAVDLCLGKS
jgi:hypothetical protein